MMADIDIAFQFTMKNEDATLSGIVTPEPHGGEARFGINSIAHPEAVSDGFYTMPKAKALNYAKDIFNTGYWLVVKGDQIEAQVIANKIVDLAFNMNPKPMVKVTQRAVNFVNGRLVLEVDGEMGPLTLAQINRLDSDILLYAIKSYAKQRYEDIAREHPEDQKYLKGWLRRVDV